MGKIKIDERSAAMSSGVKSIRVRQIQITLLILKISVAFAVFWLPYAVLSIVVASNKCKQHTNTFIILYYMFIDLAYRSSAFNVYIYGMGNKFSLGS